MTDIGIPPRSPQAYDVPLKYAVVLAQAAILIDPALEPKCGFSRPLSWWEKTAPVWIDVSLDAEERLVLAPSGRRADGFVAELTGAFCRRKHQQIHDWLGGHICCLNFSHAVATRCCGRAER